MSSEDFAPLRVTDWGKVESVNVFLRAIKFSIEQYYSSLCQTLPALFILSLDEAAYLFKKIKSTIHAFSVSVLSLFSLD